MIHYAKNDKLSIGVRQPGAELWSVKSLKSGLEYMWDSNPNIWNSSAPVLFPIVGGLRDNTYLWEGKTYRMNKHGFIRENPQLQLKGITFNSLTFGMGSNRDTLKIYPFEFEFGIRFNLEDNMIRIAHQVVNTGNSDLYFSVGGHPGFRCPMHEGESYEDYYLEFEFPEESMTWLLHANGTILDEKAPVFTGSNIINLTHELFSKDALVFKDLKSRKVTLRSRKSSQSLTVSFPGFPYLGIWAKPNGDFVCIEPWLGIADRWNTDQRLEYKEGILRLPAGDVFEAEYTIEINE